MRNVCWNVYFFCKVLKNLLNIKFYVVVVSVDIMDNEFDWSIDMFISYVSDSVMMILVVILKRIVCKMCFLKFLFSLIFIYLVWFLKKLKYIRCVLIFFKCEG